MHVFAALQPQASEAEPHSHLHHELDTKPVGDDLTSVHRSFLEVAGGVVGILSLILQIKDQIEALRAFWASFKDAPEDVSMILEDLKQYGQLLEVYAYSSPLTSELHHYLIERCERRLRPLEELVAGLDQNFKSRRKVTRIWAVFRSKEQLQRVKRFQERLTDAKQDLVLANQISIQQSHARHEASLREIIAALTAQQTLSIHVPPATSSSTEMLLNQVVGQMEKLQSQMTEVRGSFLRVSDFGSPRAADALNKIVKAATRDVLNSGEMQEIFRNLLEPREEPEQLPARPQEVPKYGQSNIATASARILRIYDKEHYARYCLGGIATIHYRSRVIRSILSHDAFGESESKELETSWTIVPSIRFVHSGFSAILSRSTTGWKQKLEHLPVIPGDSEIFKYCTEGDIVGVRNLLQTRQASPNACDENGFTALHRAAAERHVEICRILMQNGADANAASFVSGETPLHQLPINRSRVRAEHLDETVRLLLEYGQADPEIETSHRQTACQRFEGFFSWPGRISLRKNVADYLVILRRSSLQDAAEGPEIQYEKTTGRLYNGIDIDNEVESLDAFLKPGTDFADTFGPLKCPQSALHKWNVLHVLMHLRVEPIWHPWVDGHIAKQSALWAGAISRAISQGTEISAVDMEGNTPTSLALRSLFTFHVWQSALRQAGVPFCEFIEREFNACYGLAMAGWNAETLGILFQVPTAKLYRHHADWREMPQLLKFDGNLWVKCCWFQLLDILRHRSLLPTGWLILTAPRQFCRPRECIYWHPNRLVMQTERPESDVMLDTSLLRRALDEGEDITDQLAKMGVAWQQ